MRNYVRRTFCTLNKDDMERLVKSEKLSQEIINQLLPGHSGVIDHLVPE
jgi:hypothetical protein